MDLEAARFLCMLLCIVHPQTDVDALIDAQGQPDLLGSGWCSRSTSLHVYHRSGQICQQVENDIEKAAIKCVNVQSINLMLSRHGRTCTR